MTASAAPRPLRPVTQRQLEIVEEMRDFHERHGVWPTVREIATALQLRSSNGIHQQLVSLEKKGLVRHRKRCARGWIAVQP